VINVFFMEAVNTKKNEVNHGLANPSKSLSHFFIRACAMIFTTNLTCVPGEC
jgi:hypothetical protein